MYIKKKLEIIGMGSLSVLLITLITLIFGMLLTQTFNTTGMILFIINICIIVNYQIAKNFDLDTIGKSTFLSLMCLYLFLIIVSNVSLFIFHEEIYFRTNESISIIVLLLSPQIFVYFGTYILGNIVLLFFLIVVVYYVLFIFFLGKLKKNSLRYVFFSWED